MTFKVTFSLSMCMILFPYHCTNGNLLQEKPIFYKKKLHLFCNSKQKSIQLKMIKNAYIEIQ